MTRRLFAHSALVCAGLACSAPAMAQTPPPEPKVWTVTAGAGLALTSGNTDTSTVNASYEVIYDPQTRHVVRSDGLMIRGETEDELSADRLGFNVRHEYQLNERTYVFSQNRFLRDRFKSIDYLVAPAGGIGYGVVDTPETKVAFDIGLGGVWERNLGVPVAASGSLTIGETLAQVVTATTTLTQSFSGLWKTTDFGDSLHVLSLGLSANDVDAHAAQGRTARHVQERAAPFHRTKERRCSSGGARLQDVAGTGTHGRILQISVPGVPGAGESIEKILIPPWTFFWHYSGNLEEKMTRLTALILAAFVLSCTGPAYAQEWIQFASPEDGFSVAFPAEPEVEEITYTSEYGYPLPGRVYTATRGEGRYSMTVVDYRGMEELGVRRYEACPRGAETCIGQPNGVIGPGYWRQDVRAAITHATFRLLQRDVTLTHLGWDWQDLVEGHVLQLTNNADESRTSAAIHMHDNRLYILEGTVPKGYPPAGIFQQTMGFVDENGARLRYRSIYSNAYHGLGEYEVPELTGGGRGGAAAAPAAGR